MQPNQQLKTREIPWLARLAVISVLLLSALVLAGWLLDIPSFKSVLPGLVTMKVNTAVAFALSALALWLLAGGPDASWRQRVSLGCALAVAALGAVTLSEYLLGTNLGIDQLLFREPAGAVATSHLGRMAPLTAVDFVLLGTALWLVARPPTVLLAQVLVLLVAAIGFFNLIGYIYQDSTFYQIGSFTPIALHTAAGFVAMGLGVLAVRPDAGLMRTITERNGLTINRPPTFPHFILVLIAAFSSLILMTLFEATKQAINSNITIGQSHVVTIIFTSAMAALSAHFLLRGIGRAYLQAIVLSEKQKRAEEALRRSEEKLSVTLNSIGDAVLATDAEGRVTRLNPVAEKFTGWTQAEAQGRPVAEVFHIINEQTRQPAIIPVDKVLATGEIHGLANHTVIIARDGTERPIADSAAPIRDKDGRVLGVVLVFRDVTEEKKAERAIRESERQLRALNEELEQRVEKRTAELVIANKELLFQNEEKEKRAAELVIANKELLFQNEEKEKRAVEMRQALATLDATADGAYIFDPATLRFTYVNKGAMRQVGYTREELLAMTPIDLNTLHDEPAYREKIAPLVRGEKSVLRFESVYHSKDGAKFPVEINLQYITPAGSSPRFIAIVRDIIERTQAEAALRQSEEKYRALVETTGTGFLILDALGKVIDANPDYVRLTGHDTLAEILGRSVVEWTAAHDQERNARAVEQCGVRGFVRNLEVDYVNRRGQITPIEINATVVGSGNSARILSLCRDVTERKRAEEGIRASEGRYRRLFETAQDGILILDADTGHVVDANPFMKDLLGYSQEEFLGRKLWEIGPFKGTTASKITFAELQHTDRIHYEGMPLETKDGLRVEVEFVSNAYLVDQKRLIQCNIRDITERRNLEKQFRQSQKMEAIGQLAGGVAHDFNNILAIIQIDADLLKAGGNLSPNQLDFTEQIGAATQRAAALTRQLLLFSRKEVLQLRDLDLNQSINELTKMLRRTLGEDIQLQFRFAMQALFIHADAGMMDQVLMNLAVNARDAMPKGGQLVIETSAVDFDESVRAHSALARPGSFVCLSVSDTGCGIPPENLTRIFEPFFTTKDVGKGTGLGLATVFGIVQQHQGWINVYSEVGHGTAFRIYLPRLARMTGQEPEQPALTAMRGGDETILLVEDEAPLRAAEREVLSQLGYHVLEAANGIEALEIWKQHRNEIQLLLTDMVMPDGMTGTDLTQRLLQENPKLKVVYMSGYSTELVGKDFPMKEGVNFIPKPFHAQKLAQTIRDSLDARP